MKKIKNFAKRVARAYMRNCNEVYGPCLRAGISPFI